jgi:hypothetical protein
MPIVDGRAPNFRRLARRSLTVQDSGATIAA